MAGPLVPPDLLALLACPTCKGPLAESPTGLRCEPCRRDYAVVDGVPDLVPAN